MEYTLELYKSDRRCKSGEKLVRKVDIGEKTLLEAQVIARAKEMQGYLVDIKETFVTRKNLLTGTEFQERYDTPVYCSPAFESYWTM